MADSIFDADEFEPLQAQWNERVSELSGRAAYYDGSIYNKTMGMLGWLAPRLGNRIKPLYLPLARAVDVDAGIIPGGWALAEDAPEAWSAAMQTLLAWSQWQTRGVLYVHYGAVYGLSGIKVVDLRAEKRVLLAPLDPTTFMPVYDDDAYSGTPTMALIIEDRGYEYAEVITPDSVRTYKDGVLYGYGGREAEYPNEQGVVPLIEVRHIETGAQFGECTYQKAMILLDEVNEQASHLAEIIRKNAEPQWAIFGAEASDLTHSSDNVWFLPQGGSAQILVPGIDIAGVLEFVREIRDQVYTALPELAFDELKKVGQIATATLELQLMELVLKIKRTRPNYDDGLVRAMRMAGAVASGLGAGEITALDDPLLALDEKRPVLPLDQKTALEIEQLKQQVEAARNYP